MVPTVVQTEARRSAQRSGWTVCYSWSSMTAMASPSASKIAAAARRVQGPPVMGAMAMSRLSREKSTLGIGNDALG